MSTKSIDNLGLIFTYSLRMIANSHTSFRDVTDVETYVDDTLAGLRLPAESGEREWLHRAGVATVARLELAMPPERPLLPVLESQLPQRLLALWQERASTPVRTAA
jgi:hypothetical protein